MSSRNSEASSSRCRCAAVFGLIPVEERFGVRNNDFFADPTRDELAPRTRGVDNTPASGPADIVVRFGQQPQHLT